MPVRSRPSPCSDRSSALASPDDFVRGPRELFKRGQIRLRSLSLAETLFLDIVRAIVRETQGAKRVPPGRSDGRA